MLIAIVIIILITILFILNMIIDTRYTNYKDSFKNLDAYLKQRTFLLINLISFARYLNETDIVNKLEFLLKQDYDKLSNEEKILINNDLTKMINTLLMLINNSDIKNDINFVKLNKQLVLITDEINNSARIYNNTVDKYNKIISFFPNNLLAKGRYLKASKYEIIKLDFNTINIERENIKL